MRKLLLAAGLAVTVLLFAATAGAPAASSGSSTEGDVVTLPQPRPAWLTGELEAQIVAAGTKGVEVPLAPGDTVEPNCLGSAPPYAGTSRRVGDRRLRRDLHGLAERLHDELRLHRRHVDRTSARPGTARAAARP